MKCLTHILFLLSYTHSLPKERPLTHTDRQASMMTKLVAVRMMNTAVISFMVTKNSTFLNEGTLKKIQNILIADLFTTNLLRLFDPTTWIYRFLLTSRCLFHSTHLSRPLTSTLSCLSSI